MRDAEFPASSPPPRRRETPAWIVPVLLLAIAFMGNDFVAIERGPLRRLGIPYPVWMDFSPLLAAGTCGLGWWLTRKRLREAAAILAVLACVTLVTLIPATFVRRVARIPTPTSLTPATVAAMETRLRFRVTAREAREGFAVLVAPENEQAARADLAQNGVLPSR